VMHTIIAKECTGCELCIAPCPVDCIDMIAAPDDGRNVLERAPHYRARFDDRLERLARETAEAAAEMNARKAALDSGRAVNDAVARARARRAERGGIA
jgi:electron transport complex protein RnfB